MALLAAAACLAATPATALPRGATSDDFDGLKVGGVQSYHPDAKRRGEADPAIAAIQIVMDRRGISPGVIDGQDTDRFRRALKAYNETFPDEPLDPLRPAVIHSSASANSDAPFSEYTITEEDVEGPFTRRIPVLLVEQAELPALGYGSALEMLAERFHMSEAYLAALNPGADFSAAGTVIQVADTGRDLQRRVARIEADKRLLQVRAYDADGDIVAAYPVSIGSKATPSPAGTWKVRNKAQNPVYTYDPNGSAQPGLSRGLVKLPPGPNSPVGIAWIGLDRPTYGLHGTPDPARIGETESFGCIRMTNWDALELARLVHNGVEVTFLD